MTNHVFETAPSGRSKCRSCGSKIDKDTQRFGERMPNPFGDGDMTHWHHPPCAAHRRPGPFTEACRELDDEVEDKAALLDIAAHTLAHHRLQRLGVAELASSGRARCRTCRELIADKTWRLPLIFFEEGAYNSSGFIHAACARAYCETDDVWATVARFASGLTAEELAELEQATLTD